MISSRKSIFYISHGGGPMPLLGDPSHTEMVRVLEAMAHSIEQPSAIVVISAHWETSVPTITTAMQPNLIYDYGGFPREAYDIEYPIRGEPQLAKAMSLALSNAGIASHLDNRRGFDHGVFVPLKIMFPQANIPVVQLSLSHSLDPALHIDIGRALKNLKWDNLLVIGSGFSFHNMGAFFSSNSTETTRKNGEFQAWLRKTLLDKRLTENDRHTSLANWRNAPYARFCHPREEHLLPLHICYGMATKACDAAYSANVLGVEASMFAWEV